MKVVRIILGILAILLGAYCLAFPFETQMTFAYIASILVGVVGIITIIDYIVNHKKRKKSAVLAAAGGASLLAGILGVIFMILTVSTDSFFLIWQNVLAIFIAVSVLVDGVMMIVGAFTYRLYTPGMRVLSVILGILMVLAGSAALSFPSVIIGALGVFTSIGIGVIGISLIVSSFSANSAE